MSETFKDHVINMWKDRRPDIKSVRKLEEEIGLSNGLIASWNKSEPSKEKIEKIANFFDVSVDYLLDRPTNSDPIIYKHISSSNQEFIFYEDLILKKLVQESGKEILKTLDEQTELTEREKKELLEELLTETNDYLNFRLKTLIMKKITGH